MRTPEVYGMLEGLLGLVKEEGIILQHEIDVECGSG